MDPQALLDRLDADQRRAVTSPAGLLAVIAGAGSGKTTVLARRIAHRVATDRADPRHVVALTFTRQAAVELRGRLRRVGLRDDVTAGTFHAVGLAIMRQRWADTDRPAPTVVNDRRRLVAEALADEAAARTLAADIAMEIDWARARLVAPSAYPAQARLHGRRVRAGADRIAEVYDAVEVLKRRRGIVDLDDLLGGVLDAAHRDHRFVEALRWRFRHLFVDEAQDLNPLQAAVLDVLRGDRDDLTLVGDPQQAIYGFNGADPALLVEVEARFPGVEVVRLDTNYRCTPEIVAAAASVLPAATDLRSARPEGPHVSIRQYPDAAHEAAAIAAQVRRWGPRWERTAVLARTNAQLPAIAAALAARGVPTTLSRVDLRRDLADAVAQPDAARLAAWARDVLHRADTDDPASAAGAATAGGRAAGPGGEAPGGAFTDAATLVARAVQEFLLDGGGGGGRSFGDWVRTNRPFEAPHGDAVELLTFHAAKGREWEHVIVSGVETGLVPHRSSASGDRRDEEARLFYVALTRGAEEVVVTSAAKRGARNVSPSPFLQRLPAAEPVVPPPPRPARPQPVRDPVLERLEAWRRNTARASGLPEAAVCADDTLAAIAAANPATTEQLAGVPGVSAIMARRLGPRILAAVATPDRPAATAEP